VIFVLFLDQLIIVGLFYIYLSSSVAFFGGIIFLVVEALTVVLITFSG
jgi:hypothetical protein